MFNNPIITPKVVVDVKIDIRPIVRQLLGAVLARNKYSTEVHPDGRVRFDTLQVSLAIGRMTGHTTAAAELLLDGLPMIDPMGTPWVAKGMYINIDKLSGTKTLTDRMNDIEGDWRHRDMEDQPQMLELAWPNPSDRFRGVKFDADFIVLDRMCSSLRGEERQRKMIDFIQLIEYHIQRGAFPNLNAILVLQ
ncbi:hypothetical protein VPHK397_0172 [Vibrio phage K397]|nr:hypothetical protein MYOV002v2_p0162 [Vibrio phage 144E46.1]